MKIPKDVCNYLEALQLDLEGTKDLIAFLCRDSLVNEENLKYYKDQYDELFVKFTLLKKEISEQWNNGDNHWVLDYETRELTPRKECSCCEN